MMISKTRSAKLGRVFALAVLAALTIAHPNPSGGGAAHAASAPAATGIPGTYNPRTGGYRLNTVISGPEMISPFAATTGKFVYNFTITIKSTISTSTQIVCIAQASVTETSTDLSHFDLEFVAATRTGSTATCTVTLPYSWKLTSPTMDLVAQEVGVGAPFLAFEARVTTVTPPDRSSLQSLTAIPVPSSGMTTTTAVAETL